MKTNGKQILVLLFMLIFLIIYLSDIPRIIFPKEYDMDFFKLKCQDNESFINFMWYTNRFSLNAFNITTQSSTVAMPSKTATRSRLSSSAVTASSRYVWMALNWSSVKCSCSPLTWKNFRTDFGDSDERNKSGWFVINFL